VAAAGLSTSAADAPKAQAVQLPVPPTAGLRPVDGWRQHAAMPQRAIPVRWAALADCESGEWDRHGVPIPGTARWDIESPPHFGGLQWTLSTWQAVKPDGAPDNPAAASARQEIAAAETLMGLPWGGWQHWPVCSVKVGLA